MDNKGRFVLSCFGDKIPAVLLEILRVLCAKFSFYSFFSVLLLTTNKRCGFSLGNPPLEESFFTGDCVMV